MLVMYLEHTTRAHTSTHRARLDATHLSMDAQPDKITKPNQSFALMDKNPGFIQVRVLNTGWILKVRPLQVAFLL